MTSEELNRSTPIPLYYQVSQILRREIETGKYRPGDYIPTEAELQKRFNVSRATIRQAIADMVYMGLLERKRSKGTTVSTGRPEATLLDLASFTNEMMNSHQDLTTKILEFKHIPPPLVVAEHLELRSDEMVAMMERLRCVNGKPIAIERWYAPLKHFPGIEKKMFKETGMEQSTYYVLMQKYNMKVNRAEDTVSPVGLESREARLMDVAAGEPALLRTRVSYSADNRPVTYASGVYLIQLKFLLGYSPLTGQYVPAAFEEKERLWEKS